MTSNEPYRPITMDDMLTSPERVAVRVADLTAEQRLLRELFPAFPPPPPLTGWKLARQRVGDRVSNARTRLALRVAPWLSSEEEF